MMHSHREKFRSAIRVAFPPAILVDKDTVGRYDSEREAVLSITAEIEKQLDDNTYNAPNFHELRIALVAARLYCPLGTRLTFSEYAV
jgi:glycerol-3-phosphate O-acyltransferase/dihydroxyacetone phosphate acyltransferase